MAVNGSFLGSIYLWQIQWWMNNWRSNQVLKGSIWFCFVLLCCHPIITWIEKPMNWEACRLPVGSSISISCHRMLSSMTRCPMMNGTRMIPVKRFVFLSLLPLCFFFIFFLSLPEERGRYHPNGLRFDFLFYLFPGYKLPYFYYLNLPPVWILRHWTPRTASGPRPMENP